MRVFFDDIASNDNADKRSVHLPPTTFSNALVQQGATQDSDAFIGFHALTDSGSGTSFGPWDDDLKWNRYGDYTGGGAGSLGDRSGYLFVRGSGTGAGAAAVRRRYTLRVPARFLRTAATATAPGLRFTDGAPPTEQPLPSATSVRLDVCSAATFASAFVRFEVSLQCGTYATVLQPTTVLSEPITVQGGCVPVEFLIVPIAGTTATEARCLAVATNNVGTASAPFTVDVANSSVTVPATPPPSSTTPPLPTSIVTLPPESTPPPQTTTPVAKCFISQPTSWSCSAKILLFIGLPVALVLAVVIGYLVFSRNKSKEDAAREVDDEIRKDTPQVSLTIPVQPTPAIAQGLQRQEVLARAVAGSALAGGAQGAGVVVRRRRHMYGQRPEQY